MLDITTFDNFKSISGEKIKCGTPIIELADIENQTGKLLTENIVNEPIKSNKYTYKKGQVLFAKLRPYLQKIVIAPNNGVCTTELLPFDGIKNFNYFFILLFICYCILWSNRERNARGKFTTHNAN